MAVAELGFPVRAGQRLALYYTGARYVDRGTFAEVLDARPHVDVDAVGVSGDLVRSEVSVYPIREGTNLGELIFPTTLSGPGLYHELIRVEPLGDRSAFAVAWRSSWDNIQEGLTETRDRVAVPAADLAEQARAPLAVGGAAVGVMALLAFAIWAQVLFGGRR